MITRMAYRKAEGLSVARSRPLLGHRYAAALLLRKAYDKGPWHSRPRVKYLPYGLRGMAMDKLYDVCMDGTVGVGFLEVSPC